MTEPEGVKIAKGGTIEFYCADPFKYSVAEYEPDYAPILESGAYALKNSAGEYLKDASGNKLTFPSPTFAVDYGGTMPSRPVLGANIGGDVGYIAFIDQNENIIQLGDPDEVDDLNYTTNGSETLINSVFNSIVSPWANSTSVFLPSGIAEGTVKVAQINGANALTANSYGATTNAAHGAAAKAMIPADAGGVTGADNCKFECKYVFQSSASAEAGTLTFVLATGSKYIAALRLFKGKDKTKGSADLYVNGSKKKSVAFVSGKANTFTQATASISKSGGSITFVVGGNTYSFTDNSIANEVITNACVYFGQEVFKKSKVYNNAAPVALIGVYTAKFIKNNVTFYHEIPNKFSAGDIVEVDCSDASIKVNGNAAAGLGALGNDWETFGLQQGRNFITCPFSEWSAVAPSFTLKYRKVFI